MRTVVSRIHWHASSTMEHHGQQHGALAGLGERKMEEGAEGSVSSFLNTYLLAVVMKGRWRGARADR